MDPDDRKGVSSDSGNNQALRVVLLFWCAFEWLESSRRRQGHATGSPIRETYQLASSVKH